MVDNNGADRIDDAEIIERVKVGDDDAFELLVRKYQKSIYRLAYRMTGDHFTADELSMETFLRVYKSIKRFRRGANFFNWLYTIGIHLCLNYLKKEKKRFSMESDKISNISSKNRKEAGLLDKVIVKETDQKIREAISHLPEKLKIVLLLRIEEELSYEEISRILRIPQGTVMSRLNRARSSLQKSMKGYLNL
ncbi:MAG: hypothetical protein B5M53_07230 [Candidatus Cloacimonas sp. 4484_209]|nr:MAG: hypothetical protein B5M53_07230 [Candidatus Cloacimonas sp. 4484_209]